MIVIDYPSGVRLAYSDPEGDFFSVILPGTLGKFQNFSTLQSAKQAAERASAQIKKIRALELKLESGYEL